MKLNLNEINFLIGEVTILEKSINTNPLKPFSEEIIEFLDILSKNILNDKEAKSYPDIITFGFWCRRASMLSYKKRYDDLNMRIGRGLSFHIAPSNVPMNFAYSLVAGLLSGNISIVRLSSKNFNQNFIMKRLILKSLSPFLEPYVILIQYEHNKMITDYLSEICDVRVIWGGDQTINIIRESKIDSRAIEVCFADRYSLSIIDSEYFMNYDKKDKLINDFYNDTYLSDQNACTSPRLIIWQGENIEEAQGIFWQMLHQFVNKKYDLQPVKAVEKYTKFSLFAAATKNIKLHKYGNFVYVIDIDNLKSNLHNYYGDSGFFYQYKVKDSFNEIFTILNKKIQTVSYLLDDKSELYCNLFNLNSKGIDRIVPIGSTMDFDLIWDGYDLIRTMSRYVDLK